MPSVSARLAHLTRPITRSMLTTAAWIDAGDNEPALLEAAARRRTLDGGIIMRFAHRRWASDTRTVLGRRLVVFTPLTGSTGRLMIYLHGGTFVTGPALGEWTRATRLAEQLGFDVAIWDYPKSPEFRAEGTHQSTQLMWGRLADEYGPENCTLVGVGAGGGLALSTMMLCRDGQRPQPAAAGLISPWLDVSLSEPGIDDRAADDLTFSLATMRHDGLVWSGARDLKDPVVSPLFGNVMGLAPLFISIGEHELMAPSAERLAERVQRAEGIAELHVDPNGQHAGLMRPTPRGTRLRRKLSTFLDRHVGVDGVAAPR